jgi:hypothetical protein
VPAHASEYYKYLPPQNSLPARLALLQRRRMYDKLIATLAPESTQILREENLNLLSTRSLRAAAVTAGIENVVIKSVSLLGWPTNLLLIGRRKA